MMTKKVWMTVMVLGMLWGWLQFVTEGLAQPITLEEVYTKALEANEQVIIAREEVDIARQEKNKALSALLPTLTGGANYTRRPHEVLSPGGNVSRPKEERIYELRLRQPVYSGGKAMAVYQSAKEGIKENAEELRAVQENLLFDVATAYYNVLKAQKILSLAQVEVERLERHLKASESRFNVGEVTKTVVLRAQAELSRAKADRVRAEAELKTARDQLILLAKLPRDFEVSDPPSPFLQPGTETDLMQLAYQRRPDLIASSIREGIARNSIKIAHGGFLPSVSLEGTYSKQNQYPKNQFFFVNEDKQATLTLTLPLFEGGLRLAEFREARAKARQAGLERTLLADRIEVEVKTALRDLETITSVLENFKDQVAFAQENFTLVEKQFAFGLATNIDVLDANSSLHEAQQQLSNARYDRDLAVLGLQKVVGIFLDHVNTMEKTEKEN
jgi:outer membrane protein